MIIDHPTTFVIFGATGDLAKSKILCALYDLFDMEVLPKSFKIVGFSRKDLTDDDYRNMVKGILDDKGYDISSPKTLAFLSRIYYRSGDITKRETYNNLSEELADMDEESQVCSNKLFYLAVSPTLYETIFSHLAVSGLASPCINLNEGNKSVWTRILVEKPFGSNIEEARRLDQMLGELFREEQIFRIDHYLAKETLQNILIFRFANPIFTPVWNKEYIKSIEVKIYESDGVSTRGAFYDGVGALRDVGQNHILQMLSLITMEDPKELTASAIRTERYNLLKKVRPKKDELVRGQYEGYRDIEGVLNDSETETYFKLKVEIDNDRWRGVPIYLESGKALGEDRQEIVVTLKELPSCVCPRHDTRDHTNKVVFSIKPDEGITVRFWVKRPGFMFELEEKNLSFKYDEEVRIPDAYERVLYDCIKGDQTLFTTTDEVNTQWSLITPVFSGWDDVPLSIYKVGEDGKNIGNK